MRPVTAIAAPQLIHDEVGVVLEILDEQPVERELASCFILSVQRLVNSADQIIRAEGLAQEGLHVEFLLERGRMARIARMVALPSMMGSRTSARPRPCEL
jgi:hypothetical protein